MKKSTFNWKALIRILMLILRALMSNKRTSSNPLSELSDSEKKES